MPKGIHFDGLWLFLSLSNVTHLQLLFYQISIVITDSHVLQRILIFVFLESHYNDVIMSTIASQITSLTIVYSDVYSGADQRKHQSSASLAFVKGIHRGPVNSPHKWPVTRKMFPFDDVIMFSNRSPHIRPHIWLPRCILFLLVIQFSHDGFCDDASF